MYTYFHNNSLDIVVSKYQDRQLSHDQEHMLYNSSYQVHDMFHKLHDKACKFHLYLNNFLVDKRKHMSYNKIYFIFETWFILNLLVHPSVFTSNAFRRSFTEAALLVTFHIASIFNFYIVIDTVADVISYFGIFSIQGTDRFFRIRPWESVNIRKILEVFENVVSIKKVICNLCNRLGLSWERVSIQRWLPRCRSSSIWWS